MVLASAPRIAKNAGSLSAIERAQMSKLTLFEKA
jgi:hypothetical protein